MEFLGIEIRPGLPFKVVPKDGFMVRITKITLGDVTKVNDENVPVYVSVGDGKKKFVIGNLSQNLPQISADLIFSEELELSHDCKTSSVFILGNMDPDVDALEGYDSEGSDADEVEAKVYQDLANAKSNGIKDKFGKGESDSDEEIDSDSEGEDEMDSDESDEEEEEEEAKAPLKVEPPSKKRANGGALNNNASKKAKASIPQNPSGGKKGGKCQGPCGSSCKN